MAALTDHAEKLLLDWLMTAETVTRPTAWFVGLFSGSPTDADASGVEATGGGYTRQAVAFAAASQPGGSTSNTGVVTFTASGGDIGEVTHLVIFDAASGGNRLWSGPLGTPRTINNGDSLTFGIGAINLSLA